MGRENPVGSILVLSGDNAVLAAGSRMSALAVGQMGIFNAHTGLSIDGSVAVNNKDIILAVGVNRSGAGGGATLEDVVTSAGQVIQVRNATAWTARAYLSPLPKIIDVSNFSAKCNTDYALKVEFRNQKNYMLNGYNALTKTFTFHTGCCDETDCASCPEGDCIELALGLAAAINADVDDLSTASFFVNKINATGGGAPTADGNVVVTINGHATTVALLDADTLNEAVAKIVAAVNADADATVVGTAAAAVMSFYPKKTVHGGTGTFVYTTALAGLTMGTIVAETKTLIADAAAVATFTAAVPRVCIGIRITGNTDTAPTFNGSIPLKYDAPRGHNLIVSLIEGVGVCNGTVTTIQELRYEEGAGIDVKLQEYIVGGFNGRPGPYRTSAVTGLARGTTDNFASITATYSLFTLTYNQESVAGWHEHHNDLECIIAVPCASSTTIASIATMFDLIFLQFPAITNDIATFDCTNVNTNVINDVTKDGIGSLT